MERSISACNLSVIKTAKETTDNRAALCGSKYKCATTLDRAEKGRESRSSARDLALVHFQRLANVQVCPIFVKTASAFTPTRPTIQGLSQRRARYSRVQGLGRRGGGRGRLTCSYVRATPYLRGTAWRKARYSCQKSFLLGMEEVQSWTDRRIDHIRRVCLAPTHRHNHKGTILMPCTTERPRKLFLLHWLQQLWHLKHRSSKKASYT